MECSPSPPSLLSACIENSPLDSLDPQGPFAQTIDDLFWVTFWIATGIFVLVQGGILLAVFLFRERPESKEPGRSTATPDWRWHGP